MVETNNISGSQSTTLIFGLRTIYVKDIQWYYRSKLWHTTWLDTIKIYVIVSIIFEKCRQEYKINLIEGV